METDKPYFVGAAEGLNDITRRWHSNTEFILKKHVTQGN